MKTLRKLTQVEKDSLKVGDVVFWQPPNTAPEDIEEWYIEEMLGKGRCTIRFDNPHSKDGEDEYFNEEVRISELFKKAEKSTLKVDLLDPEHLRKQRVALLNVMRGMGFHAALRAFTLAEKYHDGLRKDVKTPEFAHQIQIALFLTTLKLDRHNLQSLIIGVLFHDLFEDKSITPEEVLSEMGVINQLDLGDAMAGIDIGVRLSKVQNGRKLDMATYMTLVGDDWCSALLKGIDRINNFQSMPGVFNLAKQDKYLDEGLAILAMMKATRKHNPEVADAFYAVEYTLKLQIATISHYLDQLSKAGFADFNMSKPSRAFKVPEVICKTSNPVT